MDLQTPIYLYSKGRLLLSVAVVTKNRASNSFDYKLQQRRTESTHAQAHEFTHVLTYRIPACVCVCMCVYACHRVTRLLPPDAQLQKQHKKKKQ